MTPGKYHKRYKFLILVVIFTITILAAFPNAIATGSDEPPAPLLIPEGDQVIPDQYIVVFKSTAPITGMEVSIDAFVDESGGSVLDFFGVALNGFSVYLPEDALEAVLADPRVEYVEADQVISVGEDSEWIDGRQDTDTPAGALWGLDRVDQRNLPLNDEYLYKTRAGDVHAYVIDTGVLSTHTEFEGRVMLDFDSISSPIREDCHGHGTHVGGSIGGKTYGIAKGVSIHSIRVLDCGGFGTTSTVIAGMNWVAENHIPPAVANMSLSGSKSTALNDAAENLFNQGVTVVVSAGNYNTNACSLSPASAEQAVTVGATDTSDARASFSDWGSCVDLFAPGVSILSSSHESDTATKFRNGTSMSAPHVSGAAALYLQAHPGASPQKVTNAILRNASVGKVSDPKSGSPNLLLFSRFGLDVPAGPQIIAPAGAIKERRPFYQWQVAGGAKFYSLELYANNGSLVYTRKVSSKVCAGTICEYRPNILLEDGKYRWRLAASNREGSSEFSPLTSFQIDSDGFYSSFNDGAAGWSRKAGGKWRLHKGKYFTKGSKDRFTSTNFHQVFYNSIFEALVLRLGGDIGASYPANYIAVRMGEDKLPVNSLWHPGYLFGYTNNGHFAVFRLGEDGTTNAIQPWTETNAINQNGWNRLKVVADDEDFKFYINNVLVFSFSSAEYDRGQVGFQMYKYGGTQTQLRINWASLSILPSTYMNDDAVGIKQELLNQAALGSGEPAFLEGWSKSPSAN